MPTEFTPEHVRGALIAAAANEVLQCPLKLSQDHEYVVTFTVTLDPDSVPPEASIDTAIAWNGMPVWGRSL